MGDLVYFSSEHIIIGPIEDLSKDKIAVCLTTSHVN